MKAFFGGMAAVFITSAVLYGACQSPNVPNEAPVSEKSSYATVFTSCINEAHIFLADAPRSQWSAICTDIAENATK